MAAVVDAWSLNRLPKRYLTAAGDRHGNLHAHAAELGARLAGVDYAQTEFLDFGHNLGIALKISNDVVELLRGDYATATEPGKCIRNGNFTLPVIYALDEDLALRKLLGAGTMDDSLDAVLTRIRKTRAIERCVADC